MINMNKEFITYNQALALKELGFDEPCFAYRDGGDYLMIKQTPHCVISAPTYSQAFRFFREKYNITQTIAIDGSLAKEGHWAYTIVYDGILFNDGYLTYEEADLDCLKKLIEIVKNK